MSRRIKIAVIILVIAIALLFLILISHQTTAPSTPSGSPSTNGSSLPEPSLGRLTPLPSFNPSATLIPTPTPATTQTPPPQITQLMPIISDDYNIEYYSSQNYFLVTIKKGPSSNTKQEALKWFTDHGVSNTDSLNIRYLSYPYVQ